MITKLNSPTYKKIIIKLPKQPKVAPAPFVKTQQVLSKEQNMMQQLFAGERTFGTGRNLPDTSEQVLRSGGGLVNNGDTGETGNMFGVRRRRF